MSKKKSLTTVDKEWHIQQLRQLYHQGNFSEWAEKLENATGKTECTDIDEVADEMQEFIQELLKLNHHLGMCRENVRERIYGSKGTKK